MLVFAKANLTLLATPKTGTTALHGFLAPHAEISLRNPPGVKHMPVYRYQRFFEPMLEMSGLKDLETMAFIRYPVDWLGSWYRYRTRDALKGHENSTQDMDFDSFVMDYLGDDQPAFADVGSQSVFLAGLDGETSVTHLFRYESMAGAIGFLSKRLGLDIRLEQKNVSPKLKLQLRQSTLDFLEDKLSHEFELWHGARVK